MAKLALCILMIIANLSVFAANHRDADGCGDCAGTSSELRVADSQDHSTSLPTESVPHECPCQSHHHNCSHTYYSLRNQLSVDFLLDADLAYPSEVSALPPSPFFDGPFQPPKA